ncbi:MAG: hypothetical protein IH628_13890 [Proteobacteria bacterium]|nr:hypothetical protein [Pseudomonadota bacterium]
MAVTCARCAGAELPGPADPERSWRAINLMSVATFAAKVFVRSVDVTAEVLDCAKTGEVGATDVG